ncbi:MAG: 3-deoxy-7-phosphoheptulonate synthase [Deltaproteobacteria bacterium]|nr:3-deoxy-7-phosphoheptulonate synthase [Deltaproteobacteria bacterium]
MIITLEPGANAEQAVARIEQILGDESGVELRKYTFEGAATSVVELHLIGNTGELRESAFAVLRGVHKVVRVSKKYRLLGRPTGTTESVGFEYNGVHFDDTRVTVMAGQCAVDTREHTAAMFAALSEHGLKTSRMGVYKPRTSPYDFQGLGKACLPWLLEQAAEADVRVIAVEVGDERHVEEIHSAINEADCGVGVMLQIGTRNAQNFELLKHVGRQQTLPVLFKRGMGLTIEESLNACEYIASEGNSKIIFCMRGVKSSLGAPHRNFVDFGQVPVVRRLTRLPVCIDPSHSVGNLDLAPDGLPDLIHAVGQGLIAGASMVLIEFHPDPVRACCDGHQSLEPRHLPFLLEYVACVRRAYEEVIALPTP